MTPLLVLDGLSHRFGRVEALRGASLTVRPGTVHALLGENGAGKSTLMRAAFGLLQPDRGVLRWKGAPHRLASPAAALRLGIGMVHQHFTLVPAMTVAENVALGGHGAFDPAQAAARVVSTVRPRCSTVTSSATASASRSVCVLRTTALPASA
ncbi:MAG: ATP-binding cassette domain-containing protein [Gemmatimonas sp.]